MALESLVARRVSEVLARLVAEEPVIALTTGTRSYTPADRLQVMPFDSLLRLGWSRVPEATQLTGSRAAPPAVSKVDGG